MNGADGWASRPYQLTAMAFTPALQYCSGD